MALRHDRRSRSFSAVDLFAGCGGLSLGLSKAGFAIKSAVEIDDRAATTYKANHKTTRIIVRDVREVRRQDLHIKGRLDLLAGCAPCQGFCSLTKSTRPDPRNELLLEMARLIEEVRPRAVIMENVPGVLDRGCDIFDAFARRLRGAGYYAQHAILQMADYGVPQRRRRLVLVAGHGFAVPMPEPTHSERPSAGRLPWKTVRDSIGYLLGAPTKMADAVRNGGPRRLKWHVVRDLQPQTKARLRAATPGGSWENVDEHLRPDCHRGTYVGFTNVYGRMMWSTPAPTITAGCTTPAKGRFGHPDRRRTTISVREAALLQSFPMRYDFACEYMESVCEMIGNAVPPTFAEALGRTVRNALESHDSALAHANE
jgi:DNA (cytosine-5)-methyltransferase 1